MSPIKQRLEAHVCDHVILQTDTLWWSDLGILAKSLHLNGFIISVCWLLILQRFQIVVNNSPQVKVDLIGNINLIMIPCSQKKIYLFSRDCSIIHSHLRMIQEYNWEWIASTRTGYKNHRDASHRYHRKYQKPKNILSTLFEQGAFPNI